MKGKCENCGIVTSIKIPLGTTIREHVDNGKALCTNCGCCVEQEGFDEKEKNKTNA